MESVGEKDTFPQHPLVPCCKLNFGDGKCMTEVKAPVHVWVGEVSKPFGVLGLNFGGGETSQLSRCWCVYFEKMFILPARLIFLL